MSKHDAQNPSGTRRHGKDFVDEARRRAGRPDSGDAFIEDPEGGPARAPDDLAEEIAEGFVASATSGEEVGEEVANQEVPEETGGPFVVTTGRQEFARGTDASNPPDAEVEPFPKATRTR